MPRYNNSSKRRLVGTERSFPIADVFEETPLRLRGGYFFRFRIPKTIVAINIMRVSTSMVVITITPFMSKGEQPFSPFAVFIISCHIVPHNRSLGGFLFSPRHTNEKMENALGWGAFSVFHSGSPDTRCGGQLNSRQCAGWFPRHFPDAPRRDGSGRPQN